MTTPGLDWARDGVDWPNREASRFVRVAGLRWHLQMLGSGPPLLLLHGTGASTHSWRTLAPLLATSHTVIAPDLPAHGFTDTPPSERLSLDGMAAAVAALVRELKVEPQLALGHSAGAAVLLRMVLDGSLSPRLVVSLNGALLPFRGVPGRVFKPLAKMLAGASFVPHWFARHAADPRVIGRLIDSTGSRIEATGVELYRRLAANPAHVAGALSMMANWDLASLARELPRVRTPVALVVGGNDGTVPATEAFRVRELIPHATVDYLRGLGHLAHEERPEEIAGLVRELTARAEAA